MKNLISLILAAAISCLSIPCRSKPQIDNEHKTSAADSQRIMIRSDTVIIMTGVNSKGVGRFRDIHLTHPLDEKMVDRGRTIYQSKCFACHKLSTELLVGPGWAGVTDRRKPEWIMNWITNTKVMLDRDLAAQADLVICLIRMPNQDLTDDQARDVLEFMRRNDGKK